MSDGPGANDDRTDAAGSPPEGGDTAVETRRFGPADADPTGAATAVFSATNATTSLTPSMEEMKTLPDTPRRPCSVILV